MGFPGERALDSAEYQTLKKWHEVLADFAALDGVMPYASYGKALSRLRHMAAEVLFQPGDAGCSYPDTRRSRSCRHDVRSSLGNGLI